MVTHYHQPMSKSN